MSSKNKKVANRVKMSSSERKRSKLLRHSRIPVCYLNYVTRIACFMLTTDYVGLKLGIHGIMYRVLSLVRAE